MRKTKRRTDVTEKFSKLFVSLFNKTLPVVRVEIKVTVALFGPFLALMEHLMTCMGGIKVYARVSKATPKFLLSRSGLSKFG